MTREFDLRESQNVHCVSHYFISKKKLLYIGKNQPMTASRHFEISPFLICYKFRQQKSWFTLIDYHPYTHALTTTMTSQ